MTNWYDALGVTATGTLKWPYPVRYGVENDVELTRFAIRHGLIKENMAC